MFPFPPTLIDITNDKIIKVNGREDYSVHRNMTHYGITW